MYKVIGEKWLSTSKVAKQSVSEWRLSLAMISNEPCSWDTSIFSAKNPVENVGNVEQVWVHIHVQSNDTLGCGSGMEKVKSRIEVYVIKAFARQASMGTHTLTKKEGVLV